MTPMLDRLLDRFISVTMIVLVFVILGIIGIRSLPVGLIPDIDVPVITVQVSAPDMSSREIENTVVRPLRQSLVQINHIRDLHSESRDGGAVMTLSFDEGENVDFFYIEVNEKIDRAMGSLPKMERPRVFKASATDIPAFYINLTLKEGGNFLEMSDFARDVIARRIEQLDEVAMVDITGCPQREVMIIPDTDKLDRLGITLQRFQQYVSSANVSLSNLTVRDGEYHYNVKFKSFASNADDIADVYFKSGDRVLQIKDVATVQERPATRTGLALSDGKDAVVLAVIKQSEARMSDLRKSISLQIDAFRQDYPQMDFTLTRDQTELLEYSISNLMLNIVLAVLLVCIVIFFFMKDFRSPVLVAATIPLSLVMSFFIFKIIGLTINIISLSGLLLGVGMMVDNSIVLVENITARWQRGDTLRRAVVDGTAEVSGAMLSSVLTTCAVFIPLVFLNGLAGSLFHDQAVSIAVVLLTSYVVTVLVLPVYYWVMFRKQDRFVPSRILEKFSLDGLISLYDRICSRVLRNLWLVWALPLACLTVMILCLTFMHKDKLPPITYSDAVFNIDWNENISVDINRERIIELERLVDDACSQVTAMAGVQQFVLRHSGDQTMSEASVYFKCRDSRDLEDVKRRLQDRVRLAYPRAVTSFSTSGNIFDMVFADKEPELLAHLRPAGERGLQVADVEELLQEIGKEWPQMQIESPSLKEDILYISDPELMTLYGVSRQDMISALSNSLNGNHIFEIVQGNRSIPVVMGTDVMDVTGILSESSVEVERDGQRIRIPLNTLMRQTRERDFKVLVSGDEGVFYPLGLETGHYTADEIMGGIRRLTAAGGNLDASFSGSWFSNRELMRRMILILLVAMLLLFLILASQFESLVQPVIILSEIVIDAAVCLLFLWTAGVSINIMSLIGLVVVSGIVINDSILKIDTINRLVREGMDVEAAIHEAGHRRLKAIVMTTLTTVLAVAPFLSRGNMGNDLQYPMAMVIIAGMTAGTLVSLFYVPAFYSLIYKNRK